MLTSSMRGPHCGRGRGEHLLPRSLGPPVGLKVGPIYIDGEALLQAFQLYLFGAFNLQPFQDPDEDQQTHVSLVKGYTRLVEIFSHDIKFK